jgi:hypothetical protein
MEPGSAIRLSRRYVWWQEPTETLRDVHHLLRQIMALGTPEDYAAAVELWGRDAFRRDGRPIVVFLAAPFRPERGSASNPALR